MAISEFDVCDPSQAGYLQAAAAPPSLKRSRSVRPVRTDPDSPWGLACYLSDALPKSWGVFLGLDTGEKRHAAKYMKALLEEHELSGDQIRLMVDSFVDQTRGQRTDYPVGRFWSMRRALEAATAPAEQKSYTDWERPLAASQKDYAGWLR